MVEIIYKLCALYLYIVLYCILLSYIQKLVNLTPILYNINDIFYFICRIVIKT